MNYFLVEKVLRDYSKDELKKEYPKDFLDKVYSLFFGNMIAIDQKREQVGYSNKLRQDEIRFVKENEKRILDFVKRLDKERQIVNRSVQLYEAGAVTFMSGKAIIRLNTTDNFFKQNKDKIIKYIEKFVPEADKHRQDQIFYQRAEKEYIIDRNGEKVPAKKLTVEATSISSVSASPDVVELPEYISKEVVHEMQTGKLYTPKEFDALVANIGGPVRLT